MGKYARQYEPALLVELVRVPVNVANLVQMLERIRKEIDTRQ